MTLTFILVATTTILILKLKQNAQSVRILLEPGNELRVGHRSYTHNSRPIRFVLLFLRGQYCRPHGAIHVWHNFNLPRGELFLVPFDPLQPYTTWTWLEQESRRNDQAGAAAAFALAQPVAAPFDH